VAKRYLPLAEDGRIMRAFAKIAIAVAFVVAIVWFGHHSSPRNYSYAALHDAGWQPPTANHQRGKLGERATFNRIKASFLDRLRRLV